MKSLFWLRFTGMGLLLALALFLSAHPFDIPPTKAAGLQVLTSTLNNPTIGVAAANSPGFCYTSVVPPCAPERGEDEHTQIYSYSEVIAASDVVSATLSYSGAVEMFIGQPNPGVIVSDCTPIIGFNGFTTTPATDYVLGVIDDPTTESVLTNFPLSQLFIFEAYPGQGMPWNAHSTQTVDVTSAIQQILTATGPTDSVPVTIKFLSAPCNLASFRATIATLEIVVDTSQPPTTVELSADSDTFLRQGRPHFNEGANPIMRVRRSGHNRALINFDLSGIDLDLVQQATLVLTIEESNSPSQWGSEGRPIDVHRVTEAWVEGNGKDADLPPSGSSRGTGSGATWKCAIDADLDNQQDDCDPTWGGGSFAPATAASVVVTNGLSGEVSFDVTQDIADAASGEPLFGWLVKKQNEGQSGNVRFYSQDHPDVAGNPALAPRLVLEILEP